ncbi:ABC-2 type transport system permease protein [Thermocatellispora tengchongensis]|uniref:Transport permease protein n=1 Tax=Thermocatellispora tengchongensis TaxID=1073253 RepID=A0A840PQT6_9ACTN|nr:ABC transporter permease [Thermocatellispora tengchongensis]MBB5140140.1 ABC-2 type transport system permease protein [Thermocatellispora tengchongensis]
MTRVGVAHTFLAMMARDLRVMRRGFVSTFLRVFIQPALIVFTFAYVMPKIGTAPAVAGAAGPAATFSTVLVPGIIGMSMLTQGLMAVTFPLLRELGWERSIEDRVLAPAPVWLLGLQKIAAGAVQGLIAGLLVFPVVTLLHAEGQGPAIAWERWPLFLAIMVCGALLAASLGLWLGTVIDAAQVQAMIAVVLLPITMLGCLYYPWAALSEVRWVQVAVLANPLVYLNEALRATITPGIPHMPVWAFLGVLLLGTAALAWLGTRSFTRRVLA